MHNGLEIKPEEQQQLLAYSRAVSQPLPENLNPVASMGAVGSLIPLPASPASRSEAQVVVDIPVEVIEQSKAATSKLNSESPKIEAEPPRAIDVGSLDGGHSFSDRTQELNNSPETNSFQAPEQAENPAAYQQWQPKPMVGEPVSVEQFRAMLATVSRGFSMPVKEETPRQSEVSELDELNQWLADPILRREVMARVMKGVYG